ncbi:MAG TPA: hypothetical protein VF693_07310, partial [Allosphingosinicella sp.]
MFLILASAALQSLSLSPGEVALTQAHAAWLGCLTAETRPGPQAPAATDAVLDAGFRACRAQEAALAARASALFGPAEGERAAALYRADARRALGARAAPGSDPVADAARAWGRCLGDALPRTPEARNRRSDRDVAEAAFTACIAEERAARAVLLARSGSAEADETI